MDKMKEVPMIDVFMTGPLITWFESCLETITDEKLTYDNLVNGYMIHNVFLLMKLDVHDSNVYPSTVDSAAWRTSNLLAILTNIRHFYEDKLNQVILRMPDIEKLGREPEHHVREIELLLGLLLGCAVQCPKKEAFIERITRLHEDCQSDVAEYIKQIIEVPGIVLSTEMFIDHVKAQKAIECVRKICQERDEFQVQLQRCQKHEEEQLSEDFCEKLQLRFKATNLEEQLLVKSDELDDMRAELDEYKKNLRDLTETHEKLLLESKNARLYRDELDEANASVEKLEQEITRYKKELANFDKCKVRLKELEKSNKSLRESKTALEKQSTWQKGDKSENRDLKKQVTKLTEQISNLTAENSDIRDKYWHVCEKKTELERIVKESYKKSHANQLSDGIPSVKDDFLLNHANSQIDKLKADNERLTSYVETLKQKLFNESSKASTLTQDNKKLLQTIDFLNKKMYREVDRSKNLEVVCNKALNEATKLQQQELQELRSLLDNAQKRSSSCDNQRVQTTFPDAKENVDVKVKKEQKYNNVVQSRKLLKFVKKQAEICTKLT